MFSLGSPKEKPKGEVPIARQQSAVESWPTKRWADFTSDEESLTWSLNGHRLQNLAGLRAADAGKSRAAMAPAKLLSGLMMRLRPTPKGAVGPDNSLSLYSIGKAKNVTNVRILEPKRKKEPMWKRADVSKLSVSDVQHTNLSPAHRSVSNPTPAPRTMPNQNASTEKPMRARKRVTAATQTEVVSNESKPQAKIPATKSKKRRKERVVVVSAQARASRSKQMHAGLRTWQTVLCTKHGVSVPPPDVEEPATWNVWRARYRVWWEAVCKAAAGLTLDEDDRIRRDFGDLHDLRRL